MSNIDRCFIDADVIRYAAGFAAEGEPVENCLHSVKLMIENCVAKTGATEYTCYLTGKGNFRIELATIKPYKGNRPDRKPEHYEAITKYVMRHHNGEMVEGMEADDAMAIAQTEETCICTIDKDLDMVEGWHYNWRKDLKYYVSPTDALHNFYYQLLVGDAVDNIQGCPGIGPKKATTLIKEHGHDEEELYWAVLCEYNKKYAKPMEALIENARLLWMMRTPTDVWEPKY